MPDLDRRDLVLIRHSLSETRPGVPANQWHLGREGRRRCHPLALQLEPYRLAVIATSAESKAAETADLLGLALRAPIEVHRDLREHERAGEPNLSKAQLEARIAHFLAQPESLVFGNETAAEAQLRFTQAVSGIVQSRPTGNLAVVSHATVIALFASACAGSDPFLFWQRLRMPSYVVVELPDLIVKQIEWEVGGETLDG